LRARGWFRSQFSVWKKIQAIRQEVENELIEIAEGIEDRFFNGEEGVFSAFEFQRYVQQTFIRGGGDDQ